MCFGVRDAIVLAHERARQGPLSILGGLVHNATVIHDLQARGIRIAERAEDARTPEVMITAHGASDRAKVGARALGLRVSDATCPLVHRAHRALAQLVKAGFHPVIIGQRDHVEVRGLTGDLDAFDVVLSKADVAGLAFRPRLGVVSQTTQPINRVRERVRQMRERFPAAEVRFVDTVCQPTKQRQQAAVELAHCCDVVVVIGGAASNNTRELVATCSRHCGRVHHVQTASDLRPEWFWAEDTVGITAGTSTPDRVIDEVERVLGQHADDAERPPSRREMEAGIATV